MDCTNMLESLMKIQTDALDRTSDFFKKADKWNKMLMSPPNINTGMTPSEVVYRKHKAKVLHYKPVGDKVYSTPILIVFALVNKPYILDLIPGKSVVEKLVEAGYDVYLVDWGVPTDIDKNRGLDTYINHYLDSIIEHVKKAGETDQVTLMGYCMGGTISLMYTALHPENVKNLILMATPFDFEKDEGILFHLSKDFPVDELIDLYGNVPGWYLNMSFASIKPTDKLDKSLNFYKNMLDDRFVELFMAMEKWAADSQPVAGKAYSEFIKGCFQQNLLKQNKFMVGDQPVIVSNVKCPLLNIVAEQDNLVPPSSTKPINDYVASIDKELLTCDTGHIGLSVSGKAMKGTWPKVAEWLKTRSGEQRSIQ